MNDKLIYILVGTLLFIVVLLLVFLKRNKKASITLNEESSSQIVNALGGISNILEYEVKVSRINIILKDITVVDPDKIKSISQCGLMIVGNKVQLILKDNSEKFKQMLSDLEKSGQN